MGFFHDSTHTFFRSPAGAVACGTRIRLRLETDEVEQQHHCFLLVYEPIQERKIPARFCPPKGGKKGYYEVDYTAPDKIGPVWYQFSLHRGGNLFYYGNNVKQLGGIGDQFSYSPRGYQITVYAEEEPLPTWYRKGIMYQIFTDSFYKGALTLNPDEAWPGSLQHMNWYDKPFYLKNERGGITNWLYYGGNLRGVQDKLFYLKSLGITILYFNPIFEANSNHKYNTADYLHVDRMFGGDAAFEEFMKAATELGFSVILDGVFSHTGRDSIYFNCFGRFSGEGAYQSMDSPYYKWFQFHQWPEDYKSWWGVEDLPEVDEMEPSYLDFIAGSGESVIQHWMEKGIKGFRLDVADELPDGFIQRVRSAVREGNEESILIGEVWEDATNKISYGQRRQYLLGNGLQATMNYPFRQILVDFMLEKIGGSEAVARLRQLKENYPHYAFYGAMNLIGSHDTPRILTTLENVRERVKCLAVFHILYPGVPCIYYGDEVGMAGGQDPDNRGSFPWGREDRDLQDWYRTLTRLKGEYDVFTGDGFLLDSQQEELLSFWRFHGSEGAFIAINRSGQRSLEIHLSELTPTDGIWEDVERSQLECFDLMEGGGALAFEEVVVVPPFGCRVLLYRKKTRVKFCIPLRRKAGVLAHITSVPGGCLGEGAYRFVDFLAQGGFRMWQILPITPCGTDGSPYYGDSSFAGNTMLTDPSKFEGWNPDLKDEFERFLEKNRWWLEDYALFKSLQVYLKETSWTKWPVKLRNRNPSELSRLKRVLSHEMDDRFYQQFLFHRQMKGLRRYANEKGIQIVGDVPFSLNGDSCDCWVYRKEFLLTGSGNMNYVLGVPPDSFADVGQKWNMPLYHWNEMEKNGFTWWKSRIARSLEYCDYLRLDHFRGFEAAWAIPSEGSAKDGFWLRGPGGRFFESLYETFGSLPFLAEDLGVITAQVRNLKDRYHFPGMKVIQFEPLDDKGENLAIYTGTHDNQTLRGFLKEQYKISDEKQIEEKADQLMEALFESHYDWAMIPMQDVLGLSDEARMNVPATTVGNWQWRMKKEQLSPDLAKKFWMLIEKTRRI